MNFNTKDLVRISIFAALTAVSAFFSIPIGPVPITMQTLVVVLSGMILGSKAGAMSQLVYLLLGLSGLPVFAGFRGGFDSIFRPSFGFLIGFIPAAFFSGKILEDSALTKRTSFTSALVGIITPYVIGIPYMYMVLNFHMGKVINVIEILKIGLIPFIIGDLIKLFIAITVAYKVIPIVKGIRSGGDIS
ncbi:MAG: biotin transporter BioY [Tissierellia bacterium]|nr:biotin transporter BioY [Tissierellia bacterium]